MAYYESQRLLWTTSEFSLKDIIEMFSEYLPILVTVAQGYSCSRLEIASDQIFWIRDVARQRRLVAKNDQGRYFSIPECYKQEVQQLVKIDRQKYIPVGDPLTIKELMTKEEARYFQLVGEHGSSNEVITENDQSYRLEVGSLQMIDVYQEKFLVAHPLFTDEGDESISSSKKHFMVHPSLTMIPTDIPMMLTIAVGLKTGSDRRFFQIMLNMKRFAICCDSDYLKHIAKNAEIMTFREAPKRSTTYEYIELSTISRRRQGTTRPQLTTRDSQLTTGHPQLTTGNPQLMARDNPAYATLSLHDKKLHDYEHVVIVGRDSNGQPITTSLDQRLETLKRVYETGKVDVDRDSQPASGTERRRAASDTCRPVSEISCSAASTDTVSKSRGVVRRCDKRGSLPK
ncbi:hypothetical protein LSH36_519g02051 [Paralvinella palmiformis]|uniref:Uncharacterized protein n=1 Tax=Paralvinella palmiformis TaxID=53620 RepID=A0AAD9MW84_9ANNE|nr:hypothetical protein LSH36_519g02051 [Paralvinella palmiformis]